MQGLLSFHSLCLVCLLKADQLPRDSENFFHFCYVSAADRRVRGVSNPFQFISDRQNDWELLEPPATNESETLQQQKQQMVQI